MPEHVLDQRHQRERASFAVIVHSHDEEHVFQGHYYQERPDHQGDDAEHHLRHQGRAIGGCLQAFFQRVERTGTDVAVNHAHRAQVRIQKLDLRWPAGRSEEPLRLSSGEVERTRLIRCHLRSRLLCAGAS